MDVTILGVGSAGSQFAHACANGGLSVTVCETDANAVLDTVDSLSAAEADGTTDTRSAVENADVVVETRSDADVERTRERLADVEDWAPEDALLAVVVSTTTVTTLSVALREPERLIGLHSSGPLEVAGPIEVVTVDGTDERAVATAIEFVERLGWRALHVRDGHGFVADRLRLALQAEAIRLYEQGVADPATIDATMTAAGHETGPLELADRQGLDAVLAALERLAAEVGPRYDPPPALVEKVEAGQLGRGRGQGFYTWEDGHPTISSDG